MDSKWGPQTMHGLGLMSLNTLKAMAADLELAQNESWMACPQEIQALEEVRAEIALRTFDPEDD